MFDDAVVEFPTSLKRFLDNVSETSQGTRWAGTSVVQSQVRPISSNGYEGHPLDNMDRLGFHELMNEAAELIYDAGSSLESADTMRHLLPLARK